jgi:hypothetical protein
MNFERKEEEGDIIFSPTPNHPWLREIIIMCDEPDDLCLIIKLRKDDRELMHNKCGEILAAATLAAPAAYRNKNENVDAKVVNEKLAYESGELYFPVGSIDQIKSLLSMTYIPRDIALAVTDELQKIQGKNRQ